MGVALAVSVALLVVAVAACSGGGGSAKSYCDAVRKGPNPLDVFAHDDPSDPSTSHAAVTQGVTRLEQLAHAAPSELHTAYATLIDVAEQLGTALDDRASNPTSASIPDFSKRTAEISQASQTVTTYTTSTCGVDLLTAAPPTTASTEPTSDSSSS